VIDRDRVEKLIEGLGLSQTQRHVLAERLAEDTRKLVDQYLEERLREWVELLDNAGISLKTIQDNNYPDDKIWTAACLKCEHWPGNKSNHQA
jgi:hypothetical protein